MTKKIGIKPIKTTFYVNKKVKSKWEKIKDGQLIKQDDDKVYLVDGRERSGKSLFSFQQAYYIDKTFNVDRICFTPEEFLSQIRNAPQGSVVVFDEAFRGLSSKASQSKVNKKIVQAMMEMGQRNLVVFIVLPTFFLLEMYAAVLRSNALFHIYKDKKGIRRFRVYNFQQKSLLYKNGKRKGFDYSWPRVKLRDRFYGHWPIDEQAYRKKKLDSLKDFVEEEELTRKQEMVMELKVKNLKKLYRDKPELKKENNRKIMAVFNEDYEDNIKLSYFSRLIRLMKENPPIPKL